MVGPDPELVARFRSDTEALTGAAPARLGVAVSGGPDSLALLLLAEAAFPGRVAAATVDHRLRPESGAEAVFVAGVCAGLGVPHSILAAGDAIAGNVQSGARALRYRLLARWAKAEGLAWLLTAHHEDDQAETLIMRLQRGAGLSGLSGIRATARIAGFPVARPLLGWPRTALAGIVDETGLVPVEDPSNADERYDRARLRRRLADAPWIDAAALARSAAALAEADAALDWAAGRLIEERVRREGEATLFDPAGIPAELRRRILLHILGANAPPRGADLQRLLAALESGGAATLAGVKCEGGALWRFSAAPPRRKG
ncbi:MAG TPA: tRNA lysidine(34) synthetase TilS [Allosphingosinicella sp.]|nr:tRNA lysidine(34) synthetase TilS [Allosphingosinicella sp.]